MESKIGLLLTVVILAGIAFTQRPAWLYEGVGGAANIVGGPVFAILIFGLLLIAMMASLHYFRNRRRQ